MIAQLNKERNAPLVDWDEDERPEAEKGARPRQPRAANFNDVKEEYSFRLKEYAILQANWTAQSSRYQHVWDWVRRTVEPALLQPHLELLIAQKKLSLQNVVRALRDKFQPSEDNTREQVREDYRRILDRGRIGSQNIKVWINDWFQALARAQTYHVSEVEGYLGVKDFLQAISHKLSPVWGERQLALIIESQALGEPIRTLEEYGKIFEALVDESGRGKPAVFASLGSRSDLGIGHTCPCKESRTERHPWAPSDCSLLELAITGSTSRELDSQPSDVQLKAIRERLDTKAYERLRGVLETKGWKVKKAGMGYPGDLKC
jgi:hypothetical protein